MVNLVLVNFEMEGFVVLTATGGEVGFAQSADAPAGLAGADEYMTKPFDPLELLEGVASARERARPDDVG